VRLTGRASAGAGATRGETIRDRLTAPDTASGRRPAGVTGARGAENLALRIGDDVAHEKFGEGVILHLEGEGDKAEVVVRFRDAGEKRLLLAWAPLTKL
jgi:hypothetical protein